MTSQHFTFMLRKYVDRQGLAQIYLIISVNSKRHQLPTGVKILPDQWNGKASDATGNWIKSTHPLHQVLNAQLMSLLQRANVIKLKSLTDGVFYSAQDYARLLYMLADKPAPADRKPKNVTEHPDFIAFCKHYAELRKPLVSKHRYKHYKEAIHKLQDYNGSHYCKWSKVNLGFFDSFRSALAEKGLAHSTVTGMMKIMSVFVKAAIEAKCLPADTYMPKIMGASSGAEKPKLSMDQIMAMKALRIDPSESHYHARNLFLFQFYTGGTRISDILALTWGQIKDGKMSIRHSKTGKRLTVTLVPTALEILGQYDQARASNTDYVFPYLTKKPDLTKKEGRDIQSDEIGTCIARYNKQLKKLAKELGITVNLTSHIARHSFASFMSTKGANMYQLSKALGHNSLKTTELYLKEVNPEAVEEIFKHLNG